MSILQSIFQDLIHACRSLAKARAFTFVCVATLGIGMAPVIAIQYGSRIFTTPPPSVNTTHPTPLVELVTTSVGPHRATSSWPFPDYLDLRAAETGVSMTGWARGESVVTLPSATKRTTQTMFVESNYFQTIGVTLARGAGFQKTEVTEPTLILGYEFWQTHLAAAPGIVGELLTVNGKPHIVAGIAPATFVGHLAQHEAELFLPLEQHPVLAGDRNARFDRSKTWVQIHGRLLPGVTVEQASAAVAAVTARLAKEYPATNEFRPGIVEPYYAAGSLENVEVTILLAVWQGMTAIPLLIVCLNVSGMVQVRSAMRERELSIRQAIGASRASLVRHLLAESFVLAAIGGTLASLALFNLPPIVSWWAGEPMSPQMQAALKVDFRMIAVSVGLCLVTSLVFGWLPALRFSRPKIMTVLKDEAGTGGLRAGRVHRVTTALQVAIATPLLVVSFVSLERYRATATADLGFDCELLYAAPFKLEAGATANDGSRIRGLRDSLAKTSGVASVTVADGLPLDFRGRMTRVSQESDATRASSAQVTRVGDAYLETMGIRLVGGRGFTTEDSAGALMVTVISKALADRLFPDANPIGQHLTFELPAAPNENRKPHVLTVVGVTVDFPTSQMSTDREQLLLPLAQHPAIQKDSVRIEDDRGGDATLLLVARSAAGEPAARMSAAVENVIRQVNPEFDRADAVTGVELRQRSRDDFFNAAGITGIFGGVCLLLGALGIYGVVGLMVATRTREIAVRVTLGASRSRVIAMILFDVVKLVAPGVVVGLIIMVTLTRLEGGVTVSSVEPLSYVAGAVTATLAAVLASLAPARRAASVQPMVAMRST